MTDYVKPICLPKASHLQNMNYAMDNGLIVSGFGATENTTSSDVKLKLSMEGFNWNQCKRIYRTRFAKPSDLGDKELCAGGNEGEDTCSGDSGKS